MTVRFTIPDFRPHRLLRNGHAQTLAGAYLPSGRFVERAVKRQVTLPDGDSVVLHDDLPSEWRPGDRVALLLHGLAGNHQSSYMLRIARKLVRRRVRAFRMDLRGCGAGEGLSSRPYHAGRSEDARAALEYLQTLCRGSLATVVGFSLSGNTVLKLVGELPDSVPINVERAAAVCPSLDLALCARSLLGPCQKMYERHFVWLLCRQIEANRRLRPDVPALNAERRLKTLLEFDDAYTGPVCGFGTADNYYAINSARGHVAKIRLPTLILTAEDDPLVPIASFDALASPPNVIVHRTEHGGHLGYIGKAGVDADLRWMDWRIVDWATANLAPAKSAAPPADPARPTLADSVARFRN
ncbi:MAG TPA: alpha/beta fold hydrolase [Planctomycetaceae bacterium]|jgi:predicted alpha/beta-fold hydrolase|nr:alpha/beta fold hydrolase [Planctomycetaceae bacterium]